MSTRSLIAVNAFAVILAVVLVGGFLRISEMREERAAGERIDGESGGATPASRSSEAVVPDPDPVEGASSAEGAASLPGASRDADAPVIDVILEGELPEEALAYVRVREVLVSDRMLFAMLDAPGAKQRLEQRMAELGVSLSDGADSDGSVGLFDEDFPRRGNGEMVFERRIGGSRRMRIDTVPPGGYSVSVEAGRGTESRDVLAVASIELSVGETETVRLAFESRSAPEPVDARCEVVLSGAWRDRLGEAGVYRRTRFELELIDPPLLGRSEWHFELSGAERIDERGDIRCAFRAEGLQPGDYVARFPEIEAAWRATVPDSPEGVVIFSAPHPSDVTLRFVDAITGGAATEGTLIWSMWVGDECTRTERVEMTAETSAFHIETHAGRMSVSGAGDGLQIQRKYVDVGPGRVETDVAAPRHYSFRVVLLVDGEHLELTTPEDRAGRVSLRHPSVRVTGSTPDETVFFVGESDDGIHVTVNRPGKYRVVLPVIDGFRPIPPQEVVVPDHRGVCHEIRLERK